MESRVCLINDPKNYYPTWQKVTKYVDITLHYICYCRTFHSKTTTCYIYCCNSLDSSGKVFPDFGTRRCCSKGRPPVLGWQSLTHSSSREHGVEAAVLPRPSGKTLLCGSCSVMVKQQRAFTQRLPQSWSPSIQYTLNIAALFAGALRFTRIGTEGRRPETMNDRPRPKIRISENAGVFPYFWQ